MTITLSQDAVLEALNADPEFRLSARHWTTTIKITIGEDSKVLALTDGEVVSLEPSTMFDSVDVTIGGPEEMWDKILAEVPPPYYQDFWSAYMAHGFEVSGDLTTAFAYFGALRRMTEVLRSIHTTQEA